MGRSELTNLKTNPDLLALIETMKSRVMTTEEINEQRRSFVRGMCPSHYDFKEWCALVNSTL